MPAYQLRHVQQLINRLLHEGAQALQLFPGKIVLVTVLV